MNERPLLVDYHTQSIEHGFANPRRVRETVQAAVNGGLSTICLTDHYPLPPRFGDPTEEHDCAMPLADYPQYQKEVDAAMAEFGGRIKILRGAEVDWLPEHYEWTKDQINAWPFDYVIGSVHFLGQIRNSDGTEGNFLLDYKEEEFLRGLDQFGSIKSLVHAYFFEVGRMVRSGLFDGVGHLDLIKKYNNGSLFTQDKPWYRDTVIETLRVIAMSGMSLELNAAGLDKKCQEAYPAQWVLEYARMLGIPLTTGSDGHTPEGIGRNLDKAVELAKAAGYTQLVEYRRRQQKAVAI
ncbi:MAG: histidinol-phosphatase HisJ [Candidatus Curtissbacteria bacterium]|nr:histidinol-phosphatase HisJ [Candidatus Curtissbacteria bacterium]